jgi:hypothetical protein
MNSFNLTNSSRWPEKPLLRSKHSIFRDKERRRERMRASIVAQARRGWQWASDASGMTFAGHSLNSNVG